MADAQHLENCLARSTRLTGTIARLAQLKAKAAKQDAAFDATVNEALGLEPGDSHRHHLNP